MVEQKVAINLVKRALEKFKQNPSLQFPALSISKSYYKRYNLNVLTNELGRLNFKCVEQINAPSPFNEVKTAGKSLFVYQPTSKI